MTYQVDDGNPDGSVFGKSSDKKIAFYGGTPQSQYAATVTQSTSRVGEVRVFAVPASTLPYSATSATTEDTMTASSLASDSCVVISRSSTTPGVAIVGYRVSAADTFGVTFMNVSTAATVIPVSTQAYTMIEFKAQGGFVTTATLTPAAVAASTTAEQSFTVPGAMPGQMVVVNKPTAQRQLGIANARITAASTVAIAFANNSSAAITPTAAETYTFALVPTLYPVSPLVKYAVPATTICAVIPVSSTVEQSTTLMNMLSTDTFVSASLPTYQLGVQVASGRINSSGVIALSLGSFSSATITPASSEALNVTIYRAEARPALQIYSTSTFPATSVPASTTVEYTTTVNGLQVSSTVFVNKMFHTANVGVANARVSAANTLCVALFNTATTATAVGTGTYYVGATPQAPAWGIGGSAYQSSAALASTCAFMSYAVKPQTDTFAAELRAALAANGFLPS